MEIPYLNVFYRSAYAAAGSMKLGITKAQKNICSAPPMYSRKFNLANPFSKRVPKLPNSGKSGSGPPLAAGRPLGFPVARVPAMAGCLSVDSHKAYHTAGSLARAYQENVGNPRNRQGAERPSIFIAI